MTEQAYSQLRQSPINLSLYKMTKGDEQLVRVDIFIFLNNGFRSILILSD